MKLLQVKGRFSTKKSNYIMLGVAISYILIAIKQIRVDGLLPATIKTFDKLTNKMINVMTLISFAFIFLSYFSSGIRDNHNNYQEERWRIYETTCSDYLKIL